MKKFRGGTYLWGNPGESQGSEWGFVSRIGKYAHVEKDVVKKIRGISGEILECLKDRSGVLSLESVNMRM